jgi:hypothetical protein
MSSLGLHRVVPLLLVATFALPAGAGGQAATATRRAAVDTSFAETVRRISEPGGFFDSDNLISNETSYLHVVTRLRDVGVGGGAYIGVGPDQNYSYIAVIRPSIAFLIDIRRDNALQHLMYKALFARSRNRMEFLCRLLGRRLPSDIGRWSGQPVDAILAYMDTTALDSAAAERERRATLMQAASYGVPFDTRDRATILRFHEEFMREGLDLRFSSYGRSNRSTYPSFRSLITARDLAGGMTGFLATEDSWRLIKSMHAADRIVPIVGNLGGDRAFPALAAELRARGLRLSALYVSNAELYMWRDGVFPQFARTVSALPMDGRSVIIRSYFDRSGTRHPQAVPGHMSVQLLQRAQDFVRRFRAGEIQSYWDVVTLDVR